MFGNSYGTPRAPVVEALDIGTDVLFDVDWQGARDLAAAMPGNVVSIFILPPSMAELERRLRGRAQDSDAVVAERMNLAADQMSHWPAYDYVIVNDVLDESVANVRAILKAERLRRTRRDAGLARFVRSLGRSILTGGASATTADPKTPPTPSNPPGVNAQAMKRAGSTGTGIVRP